MSNDAEQRALYEMRSKILKDKNSALNKAKEEGREEGKQEEKIQITRGLKAAGVEIEIIQKATDLSRQEIEKI